MFTLGIVLGRAYFSRASFQHDITAKNVLYWTTDKSIKWLMVRGHYYWGNLCLHMQYDSPVKADLLYMWAAQIVKGQWNWIHLTLLWPGTQYMKYYCMTPNMQTLLLFD